MRGDLCPRRYCRRALTIGTNGHGVTIATCDACERNARGLCRDCPARLPIPVGRTRPSPKSMRCERCKLRHLASKKLAAYHADPEHFRAIRRKSNHKPDVRARQNARRAEWLKAHPQTRRTLADRLYSRAWRAKKLEDPAFRAELRRKAKAYRSIPEVKARIYEQQRKRREANRQQVNEAQRQRRAKERAA